MSSSSSLSNSHTSTQPISSGGLHSKRPPRSIHRDVSWLQFNERVLAEARLSTNPLLERVKFLAITSTNLDEFFMIRFPSLTRAIHNASRSDRRQALALSRIRHQILESVIQFHRKQAQILRALQIKLEQFKIRIVRTLPSDPKLLAVTDEIFNKEIIPKLPPPETFTFPKLNHLGNFALAAIFSEQTWVSVPRTIPQLFTRSFGDFELVFFLDDLLKWHLGSFLGSVPTRGQTQGHSQGAYSSHSPPTLLRLTRDGDIHVDIEEEDSESIPDLIRTGLSIRDQGRPSRLQILGRVSKHFLTEATRSLKIPAFQVIEAPSTLCLSGLIHLRTLLPEKFKSRPDLTFPRLPTIIPEPFLHPDQIFDRIDQKDILLHHPYDSFDTFVAWIRAACEDPHVIQIEQTVYRVDTLSPVIEALKTAAGSKRIRVIIELRARFDEMNNLILAEDLRKAGVEVAFGFGKLKLHSKVALVKRQVQGKIHQYAHLSTGNYNATTARLYTDLAILTSHPEICADVAQFMDMVCAGKVPADFKVLVPAPARLHRRLISHIQAEIDAAQKGKKAKIVAKVNALVDESVIQHLYRASNAGVQVDLIVRGACSLVPGTPGMSENIRVISIVDRFLEHSRIYYFGAAKMIYLSSADWMPRNFFSRLELAFPVLDPHIYKYIEEYILPTYLSDTAKARALISNGTWIRRKNTIASRDPVIAKFLKTGEKKIRAQFLFGELAMRRYQDTPLSKKFTEDSTEKTA